MTTSRPELNIRFRFKYVGVYKYLLLPFLMGTLFFCFYLFLDSIFNFRHKSAPSFEDAFGVSIGILIISFGVRKALLDVSYTEIDCVGVRKYFLKWCFREIQWNEMKVMVIPNINYNKKILSFCFFKKDKEVKFWKRLFLTKVVDFEASSIDMITLKNIVNVLNYYISKHQLIVKYGEDKMLDTDQTLDHIPPPPYKWIGQKMKVRMDIDF